MNTVRIVIKPEDIVAHTAALPKGGVILRNSIRCQGDTFSFEYNHPAIQHPFEVMDLKQWIALDRSHAQIAAEPCKPVVPPAPEPEPPTMTAPVEPTPKKRK